MSPICEKLSLFLDGELSEAEAEHVRGHLAHCAACAARFENALQLEALAFEALRSDAGPCARPERQLASPPPNTLAASVDLFSAAPERASPAPRSRPRRASRRGPLWALAATAALAALVYLVPSGEPSARLWLADAPTRELEARLSFGPLDGYRPYGPMRSGDSAARRLPLKELSRLDEQRDALAMAAAFLVHGEEEQARSLLEEAPASPNRDNDLAVVAIQQRRFEEAHQLLERVLQAEPQHAQARWNRALVLKHLGQKALAAEAFEQLAASGEPGWSEEAARIARALREP